jgi:exosortase A
MNSNNPSNPINSSNPSNPSNPINPINSINPIRTTLLKSAIIVACLGLLYFRVLQGLVSDWLDLPDFSHGFLIPIVSLYFVYERRKELSALNRSSHWIGLVLLLFGIVLLLLGNLSTEYFTMRFSILVVLGGIILFLLGKELFKTLLFPLVFLIFMIPIPSILMDRITFPMQLFASKVAGSSLDLIGIPVLREGNIILLAHTSLEVAEACSGIRSLISLLALSVVFAYLSQKTTLKRVVLVLSTFPIAIIANAARVTGTGILAHHYGDKVAQGFFHGFSGWILFVVAFVCLFLLGAMLSRRKKVNKIIS